MIELKNVELWRKTLGAISCFIPEGNFRFNENGISLRAMDPSQIVLVDMRMDIKIFDKFDIEPTFVGMDIEELSKILNRSMPQDKLLMDINDSELTVKLDGELQRQFKLPLIDVADDEENLGILSCGTGIGMSMAANKVNGIRAAVCHDVKTAKLVREHNNANILCVGGRILENDKALEIVEAFLKTPFSKEERHERRIKKIQEAEN